MCPFYLHMLLEHEEIVAILTTETLDQYHHMANLAL